MQDGDLLALVRRIAPLQLEEIGRRAQVLTGIDNMQPVGRRALAARLNLPEREVRSIAASLRDAGLLSLDAAGMQVTPQAQDTLPGARDLSRALFGLTSLEQTLGKMLHVKYVVVVSGDADTESQVLREVGRAAAHRLKQLLQSGMTLAVTGGRTMSEVARGMQSSVPMNVMVVPARGGMGSTVETQASAIAAEIAHRLSGHYRVIHVPDSLDEKALQEMCKLPEVKEALELMERADIVVHGIGRADAMAQKRGLPPEILLKIRHGGAVGEAFGDFFDEDGKTVYQMSTVSNSVSRLQARSLMVAVAAGAQKARAIIAATRHEPHDSLITDEGAARRIVDELSQGASN